MNRSLAAKHDKSLRQRRDAGRIEGTKFQRNVKRQQLAVREATAFVHRVYEPSHPSIVPTVREEDVPMVPYMPKRGRKVIPLAVKCMVFCAPELIKRR